MNWVAAEWAWVRGRGGATRSTAVARADSIGIRVYDNKFVYDNAKLAVEVGLAHVQPHTAFPHFAQKVWQLVAFKCAADRRWFTTGKL